MGLSGTGQASDSPAVCLMNVTQGGALSISSTVIIYLYKSYNLQSLNRFSYLHLTTSSGNSKDVLQVFINLLLKCIVTYILLK